MANKSTATKSRHPAATRQTKTKDPEAASPNGEVPVNLRFAKQKGVIGDPSEFAAGFTEVNGRRPAGAVEVREIPLDQIVVMPGNPREEFDPIELRKLGEGIVADGQLQPGCVRPLDNGEGYELFIGERRLRACQLMGVPTYRASVHRVSRGKAVEMRGFENEDRTDFNAIEQATWFQQMLDEAGYTQQKLADRLGITQGEVSNTVRLLRLPKVWQRRVILKEITIVDARRLIPWVEVEGVLEAFGEAYDGKIKSKYPFDFEALLHGILCDLSRPLHDSYFWDRELSRTRQVNLKPKPDQLIALNVHPVGKNRDERAFNIRLWKQLQSAVENKRSAAEAKKAAKVVAGKQDDPSAGDSQKRAQQFEKRLYRYKISWLQEQLHKLAVEISAEDLQCWLLGLLLSDTGHNRFDRLRDVFCNAGMEAYKGEPYDYAARWDWTLGFDHARLLPAMREAFREWCGLDAKSWNSDAHPTAIESLADTMGIDIETHWDVDEEFLNLHTIEQLEELERGWQVLNPGSGKAGKIQAILDEGMVRRLVAPRALVKVKQFKLD